MNWVKAAALSVWAVLAPVHTVMLVTGVLIFADLVTGVIAAVKRKELISSSGLRRTVTKIFVYQAAIVLSFLSEHYLLSDALPLVKLAAGAIALVEMKSIIESLNEINGENVFKNLIATLGSKNQEPPK